MPAAGRSVRTPACGISVHVVFVRKRTNKNEWLAILTTDLTLTVEEIIRIYGIRWDIEVFFKCTKSLLRLQKEFQGRSYDLLVSPYDDCILQIHPAGMAAQTKHGFALVWRTVLFVVRRSRNLRLDRCFAATLRSDQ